MCSALFPLLFMIFVCMLASLIACRLWKMKTVNNKDLTPKLKLNCGDDGFIQRVEGIVGRRLKAMPKGRPRKVG